MSVPRRSFGLRGLVVRWRERRLYLLPLQLFAVEVQRTFLSNIRFYLCNRDGGTLQLVQILYVTVFE
jgi:hypothetical protein